MPLFPPTPADFKAQFNREFPYGSGLENVQDNDIQRALNEAGISGVWNPNLWDETTVLGMFTEQIIAYLYLAAHGLEINIRNAGGLSSNGAKSGQGLKSKGGGPISAKSVGSVNVTYDLPQSLTQDPIFAPLLDTAFGVKYLAMLKPKCVANVAIVSGRSPWAEGGISPLVKPFLIITTTSLPNGTHAVPYSATVVAKGGIVFYTWSIFSGALPTGLSLSAGTGVISGTPTTPGTYTFVVRVVDAQNNEAKESLSIVVS